MTFETRGTLTGFVKSWPVALSVFTYGLVFGLLARQAGMPLYQALAMSLFVFAGSSQLVVMGLWAVPFSSWAIIVTTLAVNLRYLLMGASLYPWFSKQSKRKVYTTLFFMNDESWALTLNHFSKGSNNAAFLLGSGLSVYIAWFFSTLLGHTVVSTLQNPEKYGLDFAFTAVFISLLISLRRGKSDVLPWVVAAAASILAEKFLPGKWFILIGAILGSGSYALIRGGKDAD